MRVACRQRVPGQVAPEHVIMDLKGPLDGISQCQQSARFSDATLNYKHLISYSTTFMNAAAPWQ
jgi:hypothetical protein